MPRPIIIERPHAGARYHLVNTERGSDHFGNCEVCGKPASTVYHQIEEHRYRRTSDGKLGWTRRHGHDLYGHRSCLASLRYLPTEQTA